MGELETAVAVMSVALGAASRAIEHAECKDKRKKTNVRRKPIHGCGWAELDDAWELTSALVLTSQSSTDFSSMMA